MIPLVFVSLQNAVFGHDVLFPVSRALWKYADSKKKKENWQQELLMSPKANSYSARLIEIVQSSAIVSVELDKLYKSQIRFGVKKKR